MADDSWSRWLNKERWGDHRHQAESALASVRDHILALADIRRGERVLDLGSGTGLLGLKATELIGPDGLVVFFDISRPALVSARQQEQPNRCLFVLGSALACPFDDQSFEVMVARSVLIYLPDKQAAALEIGRVLCPGGRAILFEPINRRMDRIIDMPGFDDVIDAYERAKDLSPMCDFDEQTLREAFERAGLSVHLEMTESTWPVRGKEWVHTLKYGAPAGYSGYDMLLAGGVTRKRADEFVAAGESYLGEQWRTMSCPAVYIIAGKVESQPSSSR